MSISYGDTAWILISACSADDPGACSVLWRHGEAEKLAFDNKEYILKITKEA